MEPYFTVVIPTTSTLGSSTQLADCLNALALQTLPNHLFEVVVVDDAASPETADVVAAFARRSPIEIRYLAQTRQAGLAAARNRGWHAARGRHLAFTEVACLPQRNWLSAAAVMFQRGAQVVTGTVHAQETPVARAGQRAGAYHSRMTPHDTGDFVAANCFIQKSVLQRAGGFEESFDLAWRVDADLQFKLLEIGVPILKCPEAVVVRLYQPANWYATLTNERQTRYDALLYKRHPDLFRQRVPRDEKLTLRYYVTVMSMLVGLVAALLGNVPVVNFSLISFITLTAWLTVEHWPKQPTSWRDARGAVLTAIAIPFISAYWRLYGAIKYRVLYW